MGSVHSLRLGAAALSAFFFIALSAALLTGLLTGCPNAAGGSSGGGTAPAVSEYKLTFNPADSNGSLTAQTIAGVPITSPAQITQNETIVFTASAHSGYKVNKWTITGGTKLSGGNPEDSEARVKITSDTSVSVGFKKENQIAKPQVKAIKSSKTITLSWPPVANASSYVLLWNGSTTEQTVTSPHIVPNLTNGQSYRYSLRAKASSGYEDSDAAEGTIELPLYYKVDWQAAVTGGALKAQTEEGTILSVNPAEIEKDAIITFKASPEAGYEVNEWTITGGTKLSGGNPGDSEARVKITSDTSVRLSFKLKEYSLNFKVEGSGGTLTAQAAGKPIVSGSKHVHGTTVNFSAQADGGQTVDIWTVSSGAFTSGGTVGSSEASLTLTQDLSVTVRFKELGKLSTPQVTAEKSSKTIRLSWPPVANASSYVLLWNGSTVEQTVTSPHIVPNLTNGQSYTYALKTRASSGYQDSNPALGTVELPAYHRVDFAVTEAGGKVGGTLTARVKDSNPVNPGDEIEHGKTLVFTDSAAADWVLESWTGLANPPAVSGLITSQSAEHTLTAPIDVKARFGHFIKLNISAAAQSIRLECSGLVQENASSVSMTVLHNAIAEIRVKPHIGQKVSSWGSLAAGGVLIEGGVPPKKTAKLQVQKNADVTLGFAPLSPVNTVTLTAPEHTLIPAQPNKAVSPSFTVTSGEVRCTDILWQKKAGSSWQDMGQNETFVQGAAYRIKGRLCIEGEAAEGAMLQAPLTVRVNGREWQAENPVVEENRSHALFYSPELTAEGALVFNGNTAFNIPVSFVGEAITPIDVSQGVSGGVPPYTFEDFPGVYALPKGISIAGSTGIISGIPQAVSGGGRADIYVKDSSVPAQQKFIAIFYGAITQIFPLEITSPPPSIPAGYVDYEITSVDLNNFVTGGVKPYTFGKTGNLPEGLTFGSEGIIRGTPVSACPSGSIRVSVTDSSPVPKTKTFDLSYGAVTIQVIEVGSGGLGPAAAYALLDKPLIVKLTADISNGGISWPIQADKVLDLNGHTLSLSGDGILKLWFYGKHGFTVRDSSAAQTGKIKIDNTSYNIIEANDGASPNQGYKVVIEGGTLSAPYDQGSLIYGHGATGARLEIRGGTFLGCCNIFNGFKTIEIEKVLRRPVGNSEVFLSESGTLTLRDVIKPGSTVWVIERDGATTQITDMSRLLKDVYTYSPAGKIEVKRP